MLSNSCKYFVVGYERPNDKKKIAPRFPPDMWSCYQRVLEDKPSTTNFLEGNHRGYDFKFMKNHPSKYLALPNILVQIIIVLVITRV